MMRAQPPRPSERGVALILVISVLASLMVLAAPFLLVAVQENQGSVTPLARAQAQAKVDGALNYARYVLEGGHAGLESLRAEVDPTLLGVSPYASPEVDSLSEVQVAVDLKDSGGKRLRSKNGATLFGEVDPRGITVDLDVIDDHSRPNIWSSPPFLIAASLARTTLSADLEKDEAEEMRIADATGLPKENGRVLVGPEVIAYAKREGGVLMGLSRGADGGLRPRKHRAETWVLDDRAREIAMIPWRSPRSQAAGVWREPTFAGALKEIALFGQGSLSAIEVDRLERHFSFGGRRFARGPFGPPVQVLSRIDSSASTDNGYLLRVTSSDGFNPGTVVRISDGERVAYGMVAGVRNGVRLFEVPNFDFDEGTATVAPLLRHPVNINTATKDTLVRLLHGLEGGIQGQSAGSQGRVDDQVATIISEAIVNRRPLRGLQDLRQLIEDQIATFQFIVTDLPGITVFRNALDATDRSLETSTVPFSFASYDHYTVTASATVNDGGGRRLAARQVRERIRVAPPGLLETRLSSQQDFERAFIRSRHGRFTVTHPRPVERWEEVGSVPASRLTRMLMNFGNLARAEAEQNGEGEDDDITVAGQQGVWPHLVEGDVRLMPVRSESHGTVGAMHPMDGPGLFIRDNTVRVDQISPEGYIDSQPYELEPRDRVGSASGGGRGRGRGRSSGSGALQRSNTAEPVRVDMWYRGSSGDGPLFDYLAQEREEDRIQLLREGNDLVARVADRTWDDESDEVEEVMEVRWSPEDGGFWQGETWYHLGLAYRGTRASEINLFVDGFVRGKSKFATKLSGGMTASDISFEVEEAEGWPRIGVAQVGAEVIAFERSGSSFEVLSMPGTSHYQEDLHWGRGQRGTQAQNHQSGTMVTLFGYSLLPRGAERNERRVIPAGGGTLGASLGPMCVATLESNETIELTLGSGPQGQIELELDVWDETAGTTMTLLEDGTSPGGQDFAGFPESGGYAVICSRDIIDQVSGVPAISSASGLPLGGIQFVRFDGRSGNVLSGVRSAQRPGGLNFGQGGAGSSTNPIQSNRFISTLPVAHPVRWRLEIGRTRQQGGNFAAVFPISIPVDRADQYKTPETPGTASALRPRFSVMYQGQAVSLTYPNYARHPEFVQIGVADPDTLAANDIEWVRYTNIDPAGHLLCDEEAYLLRLADIIRAAYLGRPWHDVARDSINSFPEDPRQEDDIVWTGANPSDVARMVFPFRRQCGTDRLTEPGSFRPAQGAPVVPCIRTTTGATRNAMSLTGGATGAPLANNLMSPAGFGDRITLEERGGRNQTRFRVAWAGAERASRKWLSPFFDTSGDRVEWTIDNRPNYQGHGWIAFDRSPGDSFAQAALPGSGEVNRPSDRTRYLRMLKFPSGELPNMGRGARSAVGGDVYGGRLSPGSVIDEVRISRFDSERYVLWDHNSMNLANLGNTGAAGGVTRGGGQAGIDAGLDEIPIANVEWLVAAPERSSNNGWYLLADMRKVSYEQALQNLPNNDAGLVMIGEELIAFRSVGRNSSGAPALLDCERGFMGTEAAEHGFGDPVVFLDFMPVTMLRDGIDADSYDLSVIDSGDFPRSGGTVLINDEMVHYTQFGRGGFMMPRRVDANGEEGEGLFRGRFGTTRAAHELQSIVVNMPFRYWDRYAERSDSGELGYYEFSLDIPGSWVHEFSFSRRQVHEHSEIRVLIRTDTRIPWTADPEKTDGLYVVDADGGNEERSTLRLNRSVDCFEARVFFRFKDGAFNARQLGTHGWKATAILEDVRVTYLDQTRVLSREVLR